MTKGSRTMAKKLNHTFSFGGDDLQTFVQQYKASAVAKGMVPSLRSVDERLAIQTVNGAVISVRHKRVYVNRTVNMDKIHFVGFDMDYTIVGMSVLRIIKHFISTVSRTVFCRIQITRVREFSV